MDLFHKNYNFDYFSVSENYLKIVKTIRLQILQTKYVQ